MRDYGISWDEPISRTNGFLTYNYIVDGDRRLFTHIERLHGTAFEFPLLAVEAALNVRESRDIYITRHIITFLFFYVSVLVFAWMLHRTFRSPILTCLGCMALVISPRIFADSFYNSKDIPLLSLGIWWAAATREFLISGRKRWAVLGAFAAGLATDVRVVGLVFPAITAVAFSIRLWLHRPIQRKWGISGVISITVLLFTILIFWPFLWENPVPRFLEAIQQAGAFPWEGNVLYLGKYIKASELPWHYPYVWILLTTPISYLVLAVVGCIVVCTRYILAGKPTWHHNLLGVLAVGWVGIPLVLVSFGNAVLYDGWRHLYFIYPGILILTVYGMEYLNIHTVSHPSAKPWTRIAVVLVVLDMVLVLGFMIRHHPHQQVYFNLLSGGMKQAKQNFEGDYWGLSFKQGLEYVLQHDPSRQIKIISVNGPPNPEDILPAVEKHRIQIVKDIRQADYMFTVFRGYNYAQPERIRPDYTISVDGAEIFGLYKITR